MLNSLIINAFKLTLNYYKTQMRDDSDTTMI